MPKPHNASSPELQTLTVRVPASTSNLGAGFDCLGLALDLWLEARLVEGSGDPSYSGTVANLRWEDDLVFAMLGGVVPPGFKLEVDSTIPVGRGLGSSAAAIVAGLALAHLAVREPFDQQSLFAGAREIEGHPDNAGPAIFGGLVLSAHKPVKLNFAKRLGVALAIPSHHVSTEEARAMLPQRVAREIVVSQASHVAALVLGLSKGDAELIRYGMVDHLAVPHRSELITGYGQAVEAGTDAGAYGVTISGAGSALVAVGPRRAIPQIASAMAGALNAEGNAADPCTPAVAQRGMRYSSGE